MQMTGRSSEYAPAMALIMLRPPTVNVATQAPPRALRACGSSDQPRRTRGALAAAMRQHMVGGDDGEQQGLTWRTHPPHIQR